MQAFIAGEENKIQRNKANLKQKLNELMDRLCSSLKDARDCNRLSVVGEFVKSLKQNSEKVIQDAVDAKRKEIQQQLAALETQAAKGVAEKRQECVALQADLKTCNELVAKTKELGALKATIEEQIQ